jgi:hypothetical protein
MVILAVWVVLLGPLCHAAIVTMCRKLQKHLCEVDALGYHTCLTIKLSVIGLEIIQLTAQIICGPVTWIWRIVYEIRAAYKVASYSRRVRIVMFWPRIIQH